MALLKNKLFQLLLVILVLQGVILYLNRPKEGRIVLRLPNNQGIEELWTRGEHLIASEMGRGYHIFEWGNLRAAGRTLPTLYSPSLLLPDERIVSVKEKRGLVLENSPGRTLWIPMDERADEVLLEADTSCGLIVAVCRFDKDAAVEYRFSRVDLEQELLLEVCTLRGERDFLLRKVLAADGQALIFLAGTKGGRAYLGAIDLSEKALRWEKVYPEETEFYTICFLADRGLLFAGSRDGTVSQIDAADGQMLKTIPLVPPRLEKTKLRTIQRVVLSPDRKVLAASCDPSFYLVDIDLRQLVRKQQVSHKIISGVAFSPDGRYLATSDIRASGVIEIFDLTK